MLMILIMLIPMLLRRLLSPAPLLLVRLIITKLSSFSTVAKATDLVDGISATMLYIALR